MTEYIGDIPVSSIQNITITDSENSDEIDLVNEQDNFVLENTEGGREIDIEFTLVKNTHPEKLEVEEQREEMKSLVSNDASDNYFEHDNQKYFLSVDSVSIPEESDLSNIVQGSVSSKALSWPKKFETEDIGFDKRIASDFLYSLDFDLILEKTASSIQGSSDYTLSLQASNNKQITTEGKVVGSLSIFSTPNKEKSAEASSDITFTFENTIADMRFSSVGVAQYFLNFDSDVSKEYSIDGSQDYSLVLDSEIDSNIGGRFGRYFGRGFGGT